MEKVIKQNVIAFRLTADEFNDFERARQADPMVNIRSPGMLARKLVLDFAKGKLHWTSKKDKDLAPDVRLAAMETATASQP
jgi:hypothetical protein